MLTAYHRTMDFSIDFRRSSRVICYKHMMEQTAKETMNICFLQAAKTHKTALKAVLQSTYRCSQHALRHAIFLCCSVCFFSFSWVHSVRDLPRWAEIIQRRVISPVT